MEQHFAVCHLSYVLGNSLDHLVANIVAKAAVDFIDTLDAELDRAETIAVLDCPVMQYLQQPVAVRQPREVVMICMMRDELFTTDHSLLNEFDRRSKLARLIAGVDIERKIVIASRNLFCESRKYLCGPADAVRDEKRATERQTQGQRCKQEQ